MSQPPAYARRYDFAAYQAVHPSTPLPAAQVEIEYNAVKATLDAVLVNLALIQRDDGRLKNLSVGRDQLGADLSIGFTFRGAWATSTAYAASDGAAYAGILYRAKVTHTSAGGTRPDLSPTTWEVLVDLTSVPVGPNAIDDTKIATDAVRTRHIRDAEVTPAKLSGSIPGSKLLAGDVGTTQLANGGTTPAKLSAAVDVVPVGAEMDYGGVNVPSGWLLCYGQQISRATYAALHAALSYGLTATPTNGSPVLASASLDLTGIGLVGAAVEGTGIPIGTTISSVTSTSVTMSANATSSPGAVSIRVMQYGSGDGSTTFNLPDRRGRVVAGRDDMGGSVASRLTSALNGTRLSAAGGAETHTLATPEIPAHSHTFTGDALAGHSHPFTDATPVTNGATVGAAAGAISGWNVSQVSDTTDSISAGTPTGTNSSAGGGNAHNNTQPTAVANRIIFAGV